MPVVPTSEHHEVGLEDLFFSTTDNRGVIQLSNDIFVQLSRYDRHQLVGAPHNIIRHPDMPAGVFRAMWEYLDAGKPFAGYVQNLAQDGSSYRVYALITALPDGSGYLSVRQRPVVDETANVAWDLYDEIREAEAENFDAGANKREVAAYGQAQLLEQLAAAGYNSFEAYQNEVLPAEVTTRLQLSKGIAQRPSALGTWADCLQGTQQVHYTLEQWNTELERTLSTMQGLTATQERLQATMDHAERTRAMMQEHANNPAMLFFSFKLGVWVSMRSVLDRQVAALQTALTQLVQHTGQARFLAAAARLQTVVLAQYCAELIDGAETEESLQAVTLLQACIDQQVQQVLTTSQQRDALADQILAKVRSLQHLLESPQELLAYALEDPAVADGAHADVVAVVRGIVEETADCMTQLAAFAQSLAAAPPLPDAAQVQDALQQLERTIRTHTAE